MIRLALSPLSSQDRRTIAIGAGCIVTLLTVFRGVPAWRAWIRDTHASAMELSGQTALAGDAVAQWPVTRRLVDSLENVYLGLAPAILVGQTPARATASLASYVSAAAAAAGGRLGTMQISTDSIDTVSTAAGVGTGLYRIRVSVQGRGDIRGVVALFHVIESSTTPLLAVRMVSISQADPAAPGNRPETLRTSFEVEGLARRDMDQ